MKKCILSMALCTFPFMAFAADEDKSLSTDIEFGVISTSGNSTTTSVKGKVDVKQNLEKVRNHLVLSGFYKQDEVTTERGGEEVKETNTTAEKYFASLQTEFKLNAEHRGLFVFGSYEEDKFSGFEYQGTLALGYTDRLFKTDSSSLKYSVGPGAAFSKTKDVFDESTMLTTDGVSETNGIVRLAFDFLYQISDNAKFTQTLASDISMAQDKNTKSIAESALSANLTQGLALKVSYLIKHNTHVPDSDKHADTETGVTLVLSF